MERVTEATVLIERGDWRITVVNDGTHAWILNIARLTLERRTTNSMSETQWRVEDLKDAHTQDISLGGGYDIGKVWLTLLATNMEASK